MGISKRTQESREIRADSTVALSRTMEERNKILRSIMNSEFSSPYAFEEHEIPEGFVYNWFRHTCVGREDLTRIPAMQKRGWMVVPPSRHPDRVQRDPSGKADLSQGYIKVGGSILFEREKEFCDLEAQVLEKKNYELLVQMPSVDNGCAAIPFQSKGYTSIRASYDNTPVASSFG